MVNTDIIWMMILISAAVSYLFRLIPFVLTRYITINPQSHLSNFFDYASCAIIGGIIYAATFHSSHAEINNASLDAIALLKILILLASFILALKYKKLTYSFSVTFICFAVILLVMGG